MHMKKMLGALLAILCMLALACGAAAEEKCSDSEHYSYFKGLCRTCGKPCAHIELSPVQKGRINQSEYSKVNDQIHVYTYDVGQYQECQHCHEKIVQMTSETGERVEEAHRYVDGVCWQCGYVNICKHENLKQVIEKQIRYENSELIDEQQHRVAYDEIRFMRCEDCGETFAKKRIPNAGTMQEQHAINSERGFCTVCGYGKDTCAHTKLSSVRTGRVNQSKYFTVNDQIHAYTYDIGRYQECSNCDAEIILEITRTGVRVEEAHGYEDGVCDECGYANVCAHKNIYQITEKGVRNDDAEPVDEKFHRVGYDEYVRVYCSDCHEELKRQTTRNAGTVNEDHAFDANTILCEVCGYRREACAHANQTVGYYYYEHYDNYNEYQDVTYNELRHTYEANVYASMICTDCGTYTEDVLDHTEMITEEHWIDDGICQVCGFDPDNCTHQHTKMVEEFSANWHRTVAVNEKEHKVYGEMVQYEYCPGCQSRVGDLKVINANCYELYQHVFSTGGACIDCEYRMLCSHSEKTTQEWYKSERNAQMLNDVEHVVYVDYMEDIICAKCGKIFGDRVLEVGKAVARKHDYSSSGICSVCEYMRGSMAEFEAEVENSLSDLKDEPVMVPTLVSASIPDTVQPVYELLETKQEDMITYEISLQDAQGETYELKKEILLILPYPQEMTKADAEKIGFVIRHYADSGVEVFSTVEGTIEYLEQGLGVRVSSLSPFEIEWKPYEKGALTEKVESIGKKPVSVPTLIMQGEALAEGCEIRFDVSSSAENGRIVYDIRLVDSDGEKVPFGKEKMLILPYPKGMNKESALGMDIMIVHKADNNVTETYSTAENTVEVLEQGLGVYVRSLSPFVLTWQEKPVPDLPQTGDESHLFFWLMALALSAALLGRRRAREN